MYEKKISFFDIQADFEKEFKNRDPKDRKGTGWKQFKRWESYYEHRVDENGNFPPEGNTLTEISKYYKKNAKYLDKYTLGNGTWSPLGPIELTTNGGTGQVNGNGRLSCIAFHPTDANTIYVGAPAGGFWKSTDNGGSWQQYINGLTRLGVSSIAIHPTNPDIIYIATGDRDGGDVPGYGVWKSTDGGANWSSSNSGMGNRTVYEIIMDPSNPNVLIASTTSSRIYRSTNAGLSWTYTVASTSAKDLAFHPTNPNIVYAAGTTFNVSTDNGVSFTRITAGIPFASRYAIAVSPDQPNWVYALGGNGAGLVGIYRSTDSGNSFNTRTTTPNILGYSTTGNDTKGQAHYDLVLAADPTNANIIYSGGINIWKSIDGGANMTLAGHWTGSGGVDDVHADQHVMEFSPHNNTIYNGNDGGIYHTIDNGVVWNNITAGLSIAQVYKIGVSQTSENTVINGYQDNGTGIYYDGEWRTEIGGDGMECIIDPTDDKYMYGELYYGDIRRSTNGGASFSKITSSISETGGWITPYKLDPTNANTMYAGFDNVWRNTSVRSTSVWTKISSFSVTTNIIDLAIAPSDNNVMYVCKSSKKLYITNNATAPTPTWTELSSSLPSFYTPRDIEIDPTDPTHLFIAAGNDIYESTNSGGTWANFSGTLPNIAVNTIVIDKNSPVEAMYIGMDVGVYYRDNTMNDWELYTSNLPKIEVTELEIHYNGTQCKSKLFAATYGQGLWVSDLKDPGGIAPIACFDISSTDICQNSEVTLTSNASYTATSWLWSITPSTYSFEGGTNASSENPQIKFANSGNYNITLTATNSVGTDTEVKTIPINVGTPAAASTFNENFETQTLCATTSNCGITICPISGLWSNLLNGSEDNIDWRVDSQGTPSTNTGPSSDFNPGTSTGKYAYLEASGCSGKTAIIESSCIDLDQNYNFSVAYHMFGTNMGSLHFDLFASGVWIEDIASPISGVQSNAWKVMTFDLSAYTGQTVRYRIRGITGGGFSSDIAIDDIKFIPILPCVNVQTNMTSLICSGDSILIGTSYQSTPGVYYDSLTTTFGGCDSVVVYSLSFYPDYNLSETVSVCIGDSYTFPDATSQNNIISQIIYTSNLLSINGCDSIVVTTVNPIVINDSLTQSGLTLTAQSATGKYQWMNCNNGTYSVIAGAVDQSYTVPVNGDYAVELEIVGAGCLDTSSCYAVAVLGVDDNISFANSLSVFPNPTQGNFEVKLNEKYAEVSVTISDILGKTVYSKKLTHNHVIIELNQPAGVYFLTATSDNKSAVIKLLKE